MSKRRLNTDEAFQSIVGIKPEPVKQELAEPEPKEAPIFSKKTENCEIPQDAPIEKERLLQVSFYITEKQRKAVKMRAASGENPLEKDQSAVVRAALDAYLGK
jgi:hypothetical protein